MSEYSLFAHRATNITYSDRFLAAFDLLKPHRLDRDRIEQRSQSIPKQFETSANPMRYSISPPQPRRASYALQRSATQKLRTDLKVPS